MFKEVVTLNRYKFLLGRVGRSLASLTSLSTTACYKTQFGRCIMERISIYGMLHTDLSNYKK